LKKIESVGCSQSYLSKNSLLRQVEQLDKSSFSWCQSLCEVIFQSDSLLKSIESSAFSRSCVIKSNIACQVETLDDFGFSNCRLLHTVEFAEGSSLVNIDHGAFDGTALTRYRLPRLVELIAGRSFPDEFLMTHINDGTFCSIRDSSLQMGI
jgi:hypothetical protein